MQVADHDIVLEVDKVWKRYSRNPLTSQRRAAQVLRESIFGPRKGKPVEMPGEIDVVRDISFKLGRGSALGVIGANGAGKTTLLRMLAGHVLPDRGAISVHGATGTMIDLTSGIKTSMSGRANIFLRSAVLGRRRRDVEADIDEIIDYTELRQAIEAPVSTYSAGMRMRLAFATTIFMRPDLLLVDEVLSVGDFRFRQKCLESIRMMRENAGFVLVSHSMGDISRFCDRVMVLAAGRVAFDGAPDDAIAYYYDAQEKRAAPKPIKRKDGRYGEYIHRENTVRNVEAVWAAPNGILNNEVPAGGAISLRVRFTPNFDPRRLIIGVPLYADRGDMITALSSEQMKVRIDCASGSPAEVTVDVPEISLAPGTYKAVLAIVDGPEFLYRQPIDDLIVKEGPLPKYWGSFVLPQRWEFNSKVE